jgi:AcrR family transcriptional regulator
MEAIVRAGFDLFYEHGYEGTTLRQLAAEVGIQQGSLYNHILSKQDLLAYLCRQHMEALLTALDSALAGVTDPAEQLRTFVAFHVGYHVERKREVFVVNSEIRSLEPANRAAAVALRRRYEQRLAGILAAGHESGEFAVADAPVATFGILGMLSGICTWYDPCGRVPRDVLSQIYISMIMKAVAGP